MPSASSTTPNDKGAADQILATALSGQKKYDEAVNVLQSSISQSDPTGSPLAALVRAYVQAGKADVAEQFLNTVLTSNPKNQLAQVLMGSLHLLNKQPDQAEAAYKAAIDAAPDQPLGYQALAQYYAGSGHLDQAEQAARDGLGRLPNSAPLQLLLATVLERDAKYDEAIDIYRKMIVVDPTSTIVANNLASLLSDYHNDPASLDEAFQIASRFRSSDIPQFLDTLGWIYYLRGDNAQALTLLKTAADRLPAIAAVQYHLGMAYKALGQNELAANSLDRAVTVAGTAGFPQLDKAKAALAEIDKAKAAPSSVN